MSASRTNHRRVVVETVEEGETTSIPVVGPLSKTQTRWRPGEIRSSLAQKIDVHHENAGVKAETILHTDAHYQGRDGVKLPDFFKLEGSSQEKDIVPSEQESKEDLIDFRSVFNRGLSNLSGMKSIAMSVPAFLTVLALLTGLAFFAGKLSAQKQNKVAASQSPPTLEPVVLNTDSSGPVEGTPDEIIAQVRTEFATAIEASKKTNQTPAEKEEVSKNILHILDVLGKAVTAYPDVASLFFERAQVEKMVMQSAPSLRPQAESDYKKAISLSPLTGEYYTGFADFYDVSGDKKTATETYEKAIQLNPKSIDALYPLAKLYTLAGRKDEALIVYKHISGLLSPGSSQYSQIQQEIAVLDPASVSASSSASQTSGN